MEKEEMVTLYDPTDIQKIFKCGRKRSYEIMHLKGFPSIKIGKNLFVEKTKLEQWLDRIEGQTVTALKKAGRKPR